MENVPAGIKQHGPFVALLMPGTSSADALGSARVQEVYYFQNSRNPGAYEMGPTLKRVFVGNMVRHKTVLTGTMTCADVVGQIEMDVFGVHAQRGAGVVVPAILRWRESGDDEDAAPYYVVAVFVHPFARDLQFGGVQEEPCLPGDNGWGPFTLIGELGDGMTRCYARRNAEYDMLRVGPKGPDVIKAIF